MSNIRRGKLTFSMGQVLGTIHMVLLCLLLVLKVIRAYSGAASTGGVWNYIQLFFVGSGLLFSIRYARIHRRQPALAVFIVFGVITFLIACTKLSTFSIAQLFNLFTIPYGPMMLVWVYYLSMRGKIQSMHRYVYWVYYIIAVIVVLAMLRYRGGMVSERGAVADVYYVVALMPFAMYHIRKRSNGLLVRSTKRKNQEATYRLNWKIMLPILAAAAGTVLTGKRAGMLAVVAMFLAYFFIVSRQQKDGRRQFNTLLLFGFVILLALLVLSYLEKKYDLGVIERLMRLAEDGGSNRDVIWAARLQAVRDATPMQLLFGYRTSPFVGHAHNDFLELMTLYGIFSPVLFMAYFLLLAAQLRKMLKTRYPYAAEFSAAIISGFFLAMFSFFVIDPTYITSHVFSVGVLMADYQGYLKGKVRRK